MAVLQVHGGPAGGAAGLPQRQGAQQAGEGTGLRQQTRRKHPRETLACSSTQFHAATHCVPALGNAAESEHCVCSSIRPVLLRAVLSLPLQALLTAYIPYLTIDCTAELVLFKPNIGNVLGERQAAALHALQQLDPALAQLLYFPCLQQLLIQPAPLNRQCTRCQACCSCQHALFSSPRQVLCTLCRRLLQLAACTACRPASSTCWCWAASTPA